MHGLAQREGAITCHTRYQKRIFEDERKNLNSPLICYGDADLYICFEPVEALRRGIFASYRTSFVINDYIIPSVTVTADLEKYPSLDKIKEILKGYSQEIYFINATGLALTKFGSTQQMNLIMLGFAIPTHKIPFIEIEHYEEVIKEWLEEPDKNIKALNLGLEEGMRILNKS
jgi:Pyruvate/2-oxoacid:ferredoxin oxidoreductase gamma subunit